MWGTPFSDKPIPTRTRKYRQEISWSLQWSFIPWLVSRTSRTWQKSSWQNPRASTRNNRSLLGWLIPSGCTLPPRSRDERLDRRLRPGGRSRKAYGRGRVRSWRIFKSEKGPNMGMDQYLLIPFLVGWTSIYQLFWCELQGYYWFWHTAIWSQWIPWISGSSTPGPVQPMRPTGGCHHRPFWLNLLLVQSRVTRHQRVGGHWSKQALLTYWWTQIGLVACMVEEKWLEPATFLSLLT